MGGIKGLPEYQPINASQESRHVEETFNPYSLFSILRDGPADASDDT